MFASASWGRTEGLDFLIRLAIGGSVGITTLLAGMLLCYIVLTQVGKTWFVHISRLNHQIPP
jgi:isoprenylcysteine carboxyl methyltransferase (ICMT) family protein YpbQ